MEPEWVALSGHGEKGMFLPLFVQAMLMPQRSNRSFGEARVAQSKRTGVWGGGPCCAFRYIRRVLMTGAGGNYHGQLGIHV